MTQHCSGAKFIEWNYMRKNKQTTFQNGVATKVQPNLESRSNGKGRKE